MDYYYIRNDTWIYACQKMSKSCFGYDKSLRFLCIPCYSIFRRENTKSHLRSNACDFMKYSCLYIILPKYHPNIKVERIVFFKFLYLCNIRFELFNTFSSCTGDIVANNNKKTNKQTATQRKLLTFLFWWLFSKFWVSKMFSTTSLQVTQNYANISSWK